MQEIALSFLVEEIAELQTCPKCIFKWNRKFSYKVVFIMLHLQDGLQAIMSKSKAGDKGETLRHN